jgi:hypothetical protein
VLASVRDKSSGRPKTAPTLTAAARDGQEQEDNRLDQMNLWR